MQRYFRLNLDWTGPFRDIRELTARVGIYMVLAGKRGADGKWDATTYRLLEVGESGGTADSVASEERADCWAKHCPGGYQLLFKFAAMRITRHDEAARQTVECCLRAHHRPLPCGIRGNLGYDREDSVVILNSGSFPPLRPMYSCKKQASQAADRGNGLRWDA